MGEGVVIFDSDARYSSEFKDKSVLLVGVRKFGQGSNSYPMRAITEDLISCCDGLMERALSWGSMSVVVSARVLDPVFAKTKDSHFGGLSTRELCYFLERLRMMRNFDGAQLRDFDEAPELRDFLASIMA
ncbi:hypothetical protein J4219_04165 [Candidatus Woesearchaeota archaeon]|nr:hypothetical protein [Candidatus Woesearchaeota archaeon]